MEDRVKDNKEKLAKLGYSTLHHPLYSLKHNRRLRIFRIEGDWLQCNENDGTTPVEGYLHLRDVKVY